jgi:hypothetical protein
MCNNSLFYVELDKPMAMIVSLMQKYKNTDDKWKFHSCSCLIYKVCTPTHGCLVCKVYTTCIYTHVCMCLIYRSCTFSSSYIHLYIHIHLYIDTWTALAWLQYCTKREGFWPIQPVHSVCSRITNGWISVFIPVYVNYDTNM